MILTQFKQLGFQGKGLGVQQKPWQASKITLTHLTEQFLVPVDLVGKFVSVDFRHGQGDAVADDGDDDHRGLEEEEDSDDEDDIVFFPITGLNPYMFLSVFMYVSL